MNSVNDKGYSPFKTTYKNRIFPRRAFKCEKCNETFDSFKWLKQHKKDVHAY